MINNWFIESITLVKSATPPTKEEMEKLLPSSWPAGWEEVDLYCADGIATISLAHINPDPKNEPGVSVVKTGYGIAFAMPSLKPGKFDFVGHLSITGYGDKQTARQFFESYQTIPTQGMGAPTPGASIDIPLGDLIKAFAPEELAGKMQSALKEGFAKSGVRIEKGKYLGEEAFLAKSRDGKIGCTAVLINNFVITGLLLMHSGFIEGLEQIFSKIKGGKEETKEVNAEIERGETKIENPGEKSRIENGDTIKTGKRTQVNIADSVGNKMWIGGQSKVKIKTPSNFELLLGSITAFIKSLRVKGKFEIHTPTAVLGVRGTIFFSSG